MDGFIEQRAEPLFDLTPETPHRRIISAMRDLRAGVFFWRLFCKLGWLDIKLRYRGSLLGPLWITLSTAVMIAAMGGIYAYLFKASLSEYLPFLTLSIVLWGGLNTMVSEGTQAFTSVQPLIHSIRIPFSVHALRTVIRNIFLLLHNIIVVVAVFLIYHIHPHFLLAIPAVALWIINGFFLCLMLGALGARFRDISPIIGSVLQIMFFITPIIWKPDLVYVGRQYMLFNPFYPLIEILRGPLLGEIPRLSIWLAACFYTVIICVAGFFIFAKTRSRLAYWV